MTTDEAVKRQAGRDCLVRELVEALRNTSQTLRIACIAITDNEARRMALDVVNQANALLARAKEQQQ